MKRLSIKMRMALWYTLMMLAIVGLVLGFMLAISGSVAQSDAESALVALVDKNAGEAEYDDGALDLDDDFVFYSSGVSAMVYSASGELLAGAPPDDFSQPVELSEGGVKQIEWNGKTYLVYDRCVREAGQADLWVRGIAPADAASGAVGSLLRIALITLPILVVLGALGGYWIARRSLRPIEQVRAAAAEIAGGGDLSRRIALGSGRDEIYRLAGTFDEMLARLQRAFDNERRFTADVSHELRTPTSVILAQSEYALCHASGEPEYRDSLLAVQRQGRRMQQLISQLLLLSRIDQGTQPAQFAPTDLGALLEAVLSEQRASHADSDISLAARLASGATAMADGSLISILVGNLIDNAYKYGKPGGSIELALRQRNGQIEIEVSDDGIGIEPARQQQVFERFYQADSARAGGGAGLGLSLAAKIAALHGGQIALRSSPGAGSAFTFTFPKNSAV